MKKLCKECSKEKCKVCGEEALDRCNCALTDGTFSWINGPICKKCNEEKKE
jgi:hypothetical protein